MNLNNYLILAAGRGLSMDGIHKLKLLVPGTQETFRDHLEKNFYGNFSFVVGYRAAELVSYWPDLNIFYNNRWFETGSSYSACIGLDGLKNDTPITVMPCDLIYSKRAVDLITQCDSDSIFIVNTENRSPNSLNVVLDGKNIIKCYRGPKKDGNHYEATGIVKIFSTTTLNNLIDNCYANPNSYLLETVINSSDKYNWVDLTNDVREVNTSEEYFELWNHR